ncbi:MAG: hypothetical protein R2880_21275 [Deinococcales bacterium]
MMKKQILGFSLALGLGISGFALVSAQVNSASIDKLNQESTILAHDGKGMRGGMGMRGGPMGGVLQGLGGLEPDTTITATFYDADPAAGGNVINTLSLILGQDSERSFIDAFQQAAASASFVVVNDGTNEQVIDLSQMAQTGPHQEGHQQGFGPQADQSQGFAPGFGRGGRHGGPQGGFSPQGGLDSQMMPQQGAPQPLPQSAPNGLPQNAPDGTGGNS